MKRPVSLFLAALVGSSFALARDTADQAVRQTSGLERVRAYYGTALDGVTDINRMAPIPELKGRLYEVLQRTHTKRLSYQAARRAMFGDLYLTKSAETGKPQLWDVYCQRYLTADDVPGIGRDSIPDHTRVNAEHTWPQSRFNANEDRETQKTDLHHLFPTNSERNRIRSNYEFGEVDPTQSQRLESPTCAESSLGRVVVPFGIPITDANQVRFEVPPAHKGNVARALMYFSVRYRAPLSPVEEYYMRMWHEQDPVNEEDRRLNDGIQELQGNRNPFIDFPELVDLIPDFGSSEYRRVSRSGNSRGGDESSSMDKDSDSASNGTTGESTPNQSAPQGQGMSQSPNQSENQASNSGRPTTGPSFRFSNGVLTVLNGSGETLLTRDGIVAACRHSAFGVAGASHSSYEVFALGSNGTLFKFRGGRRLGDVQTERARGSDLPATMAAMGLTCLKIEAN